MSGIGRAPEAEVAETTLGIDLASQDGKTAACLVRWGTVVEIELARAGIGDADLAELMRGADQVGIVSRGR